MASVMVLGEGKVTMVYDDKWAVIVAALHGSSSYPAPRVTDVERVGDEWVATHRETGTVIARGPVRSEVIDAEVRWLEDRMTRK